MTLKFTIAVEINKPLDEVIGLFDDPNNLKHWHIGFVSLEHISGTPGLPGTKSKLTYQIGKRKMELIETIIVRNLPDEFTCTYEADGVFNLVKNSFEDFGDDTTCYVSYNEFQLKGFIMNFLGFVMPNVIKNETMKYLLRFKAFAEN